MMIAIGVAMASYGETHLNMFGLAAMVISVFAGDTKLPGLHASHVLLDILDIS